MGKLFAKNYHQNVAIGCWDIRWVCCQQQTDAASLLLLQRPRALEKALVLHLRRE